MEANYEALFAAARRAAAALGTTDPERLGRAVRTAAQRLRAHTPQLLAANARDLEAMAADSPLRDRLLLTAERIDAILKLHRGKAFVSINKALVTQASSAIPVVPLYVSILYKVMKEKGLHEDCIRQIQRLFATQLYNDNFLDFDDDGRVRIDNLELRDDVQKEVFEIWPKVNTQNLNELTDFAGYKSEFMKLFGFGRPDVDYSKDVEI